MNGAPADAPSETTSADNGWRYDIDRQRNLPVDVRRLRVQGAPSGDRFRDDRDLDIDNAVDRGPRGLRRRRRCSGRATSTRPVPGSTTGSRESSTGATSGRRPSTCYGKRGIAPRPGRLPGVAEEVAGIKGGKPTIQEVAAVSDDVLEPGTGRRQLHAPRCGNAFDDFVGQTPVYDSLELPDVVTDETAKAEVEPAKHPSRRHGLRHRAARERQLFMAVDTRRAGLVRRRAAGRRERRAALRRLRVERTRPLGPGRPPDPVRPHRRARRLPAAVLLRDLGAGPQPLPERVPGRRRDRAGRPSRGTQPCARPRATCWPTPRSTAGPTPSSPPSGSATTSASAWRSSRTPRCRRRTARRARGRSSSGSAMTSGRTPNIAKERTLASTGKEILDLLALEGGRHRRQPVERSPVPADDDARTVGVGVHGEEYAARC